MKKILPHQIEGANEARMKLLKHRIVYIAWKPRTMKTITSLHTCTLLMGKQNTFNVLFVTKKGAMLSIEQDAEDINIKYNLTVINHDSVHKVKTIDRWDVIILDEAHSIGGFPKAGDRVKKLKPLFDDYTYLILLSGTPFPESKAQLYHQFCISKNSPWKEYKNFYKWSKEYINIYTVNFGYGNSNKYDKVIEEKVDNDINKYLMTKTTEEVGLFKGEIEEEVLLCDMKPYIQKLIDTLKKDRVYETKDKEVILGDTGVKLMNKIRQISSGTIIFESKESMILDDSKVKFIKQHFRGKKIAIFYIYKKEEEMLMNNFPYHTHSAEYFNNNKHMTYIGNMRSTEGLNLSKADALVFMNIDFSCVAYIQSKDRMTHKDREKENKVYYIFNRLGIERDIYKRVKAKEDYTSSIFLRENKMESKQLKLL